VNLEKLIKQLRRDMTANPKKAAALGVMILVALYFWGPLAWNWIAPSASKRSSKMNTSALILTDDPAEPTQQHKARGGAKFRWEKVRELVKHDSRMVSATFDPTWIDPFAKSAAAISSEAAAAAQSDAVTSAAAAAPVEFSDLGIVLGGVFVGARSRVATINGEAHREGETIVVADKSDKTVIQRVRVAQIRRQAVVLEVGGRTFTVELTAPKLAHGDEIERDRRKDRN
jgi:hypothetical protein